MNLILTCLISFLVGGIPFGYLLGRCLLKDDIRNHGSGNIGATNVARVIGWKWGAIVLFLDALKGFLPTFGAMQFQAGSPDTSMEWHLPVAAGVSAIIGHMYPIYLKLRGGKGVATALGVVLVLAPKAVLAAFAVFAVIVGSTRLVALGSILAAATFGATQLFLMRDHLFESSSISLTAFSITIPLLIIWRHRSNIVRLISGSENRVAAKKSGDS